jgi:hypothetical protein
MPGPAQDVDQTIDPRPKEPARAVAASHSPHDGDRSEVTAMPAREATASQRAPGPRLDMQVRPGPVESDQVNTALPMLNGHLGSAAAHGLTLSRDSGVA